LIFIEKLVDRDSGAGELSHSVVIANDGTPFDQSRKKKLETVPGWLIEIHVYMDKGEFFSP